jgi:hypothetical protein
VLGKEVAARVGEREPPRVGRDARGQRAGVDALVRVRGRRCDQQRRAG